MQHKNIITYIIPIFIISLFGSIIFFLIPGPQSYILFFFFTILAIIITLTLLGKTFTIKFQVKNTGVKLYIFFILVSFILLILQLSNIYIEMINAALYVIVFIFALGFSILTILEFKPSFSNIEFIALAYPLSLASLAVFGTIVLIFPSTIRGIILLLFIVFLSTLSLLVKKKEKQTIEKNQFEFILKNNEIILVLFTIIFIYFYIDLYPQITRLLGLDIARNFLYALAFTKNNLDFYSVDALYPLFQVIQSSMIYIKLSVETFQITTIFFNLFAILTFYAMASQYLKRYGDHTPAIATLIWALFAGFGWLNFFSKNIFESNVSMLSLIGQTNAFSYGDIIWRRLFFYLSMEVSLTLVFAMLYLLKRNDLSKNKQIFLLVLLMSPLLLMHIYAIYFLYSLLICFAIVGPLELKTQLKYVSYSLIISLFSCVLLNYILSIKTSDISIQSSTFLECLIMGTTIFTIIYLREKNLTKSIDKKILKNKLISIPFILLILYSASLLLWFNGNLIYNFNNLNRFGYVPWFLYPEKLGIAGIMAIIAIYIILKNPENYSKELIAISASILLMIFASRSISMMQMQYTSEFTFNPNSWLSESIREIILNFREERTFELYKIPIAIMAAIVLSKHTLSRIKQKTSFAKYIAIPGLVSLILISGVSSIFLGFEYYHETSRLNQINPLELDSIKSLQNKVYETGKSIIISPQTPNAYLDFTGATVIVTESPAAWKSKSPELPLFVTRYTKTTPTYIYLHKIRDYNKLSEYSGNYLEHVSNISPIFQENSEVQVKIIGNYSIPTPQSSTALIVPYDYNKMTISKSFYEEKNKQSTILALYFEENMQSMNFYQPPINYNNVEIKNMASFNGVNSYIRINGTGINFDKISVEIEFQPLNLNKNQVLISKFDWGSPPKKSWEIAQYGKTIVFKVSSNGVKEEVLQTNEMLEQSKTYTIKCEYDGNYLQIFVNNKVMASKPYQNGIYKSNVDLIVGGELNNNKPLASTNMNLKGIRILNDVPLETESIFYVYDLLSVTGFNYTTILSTDDSINNYKTLILPYDDIVTKEILNKLYNQSKINFTSIIIINSNGYGPLLNLFGDQTTDTFLANKIFTNKYLTTNYPLKIPIINPNKNTEIRSQFANDIFSSPFIMMTTQNGINLIYINIYPLIEQNQLSNQALLQSLKETIGDNYIKIYNENSITSWFAEPSLLFTKFSASGTINILSNSVAYTTLPENITINKEEHRNIQINSTKITVQKGYGFYTTIVTQNPTISFQSNHTDSQTSKIQIAGNVTLLLRQPEISIDGEIQFENFYMLHPSIIYTDGRKTTLNGHMTLKIYVSDEYTIALPYKFDSQIKVKYEQPLMEFNEITSLIYIIPYIILCLIIMVGFLLI